MKTPLTILDTIENAGYEAVIVGGAVRDIILKKSPKDIDIATNAPYEKLKELFLDAKLDEVGKNFKVLIVDGIEVATYRKDVYDITEDLKLKLSNVFTSNCLEVDLGRRDLTINAMAMRRIVRRGLIPQNPIDYAGYTWELIDPFNGVDDLKNKTIRFVGNPSKRIKEDPIRMIRACRFLSKYNFRFDISTMLSIINRTALLLAVPKERISIEIKKAMKSENAGNFFRALANCNLLSMVFPDMMPTINHYGGKHHNEPIFEHAVEACNNIVGDNPLLKIAAFLHDIGKPISWKINSDGSFKGHEKYALPIAKDNLKTLKFSNNEISYILSIIELHMLDFNIDSSSKHIRKILVKLAERNIEPDDFIKMVIADHDANYSKKPHDKNIVEELNTMINDAINHQPACKFADLEVDGNDIMKILDIKPCKKVGEVLKNILDLVIDSPHLNDKETLYKIIESFKG